MTDIEWTNEEIEQLYYAAGHLMSSENYPDDPHAGDSRDLALDTFAEIVNKKRMNVVDLPDAETAWAEFRRYLYIDPKIDTPQLRVAFIQGHRVAVAALTTRAKHLADEWEPHPDGDIQMFVAQLLGSKDD